MKHYHLDLHVNKHVIGTIIVSSLTVIVIAALEFTHLNSALAFEKEAVISHFHSDTTVSQEDSKNTTDSWGEDTYSNEVDLNAAEEIAEETLEAKAKMKGTLESLEVSSLHHPAIQKAKNLNDEKKALVIQRIEKQESTLKEIKEEYLIYKRGVENSLKETDEDVKKWRDALVYRGIAKADSVGTQEDYSEFQNELLEAYKLIDENYEVHKKHKAGEYLLKRKQLLWDIRVAIRKIDEHLGKLDALRSYIEKK